MMMNVKVPWRADPSNRNLKGNQSLNREDEHDGRRYPSQPLPHGRARLVVSPGPGVLKLRFGSALLLRL
jgi:hypothetical protein